MTKQNIDDLEKLQKLALKIILQNNYNSYTDALKRVKLPTLKMRRERLCLSFAKKTEKNEKYRPWFQKSKQTTRKNPFKETSYRTKAYETSPIPYLISLLNK